MDAVFSRMLQISLSGSVIVLAVLLLRLVLRRAPKRVMCLLWMIAVLRLLVPFEIESRWSLQPDPVVEFTPPVQEDYFDSGTVQAPIPPEYLDNAVEYPLVETPRQHEPVALLPWFWAAGVGLLAIHGCVSFARLKRRVRGAIILEEGVWTCPGLDTAFVLGFLRPQIYLPVLSRQERELVLLHERCHIRRGDHWWKLLAYAAVSLHWFNPLAWVTYILMCRDMELACDQETVKGMDNAKRKAYSAALLRCAVKRSGIAACPVAFGEISVKERIKMVLNYKKPGFWVTAIALVAAIVVGVCLLTSPKELTDAERCQEALEQWQELESIHLHTIGVFAGDYALNEYSRSDYWASGANALKRVAVDGNTHWSALLDGRLYTRADWTENEESGSTDWVEDTVTAQWTKPWILSFDWDAWEITHTGTVAQEQWEEIRLEAYRPGDGVYDLTFRFNQLGLEYIQRRYEVVVPDEQGGGDDVMAVMASEEYTLAGSDRIDIEIQMKDSGPTPELVGLYRELERLQNAKHLHLVVEMEGGGDYPGWDSCRAEYLKSEDIWSWNYDYQTPSGPFTTSYLWNGGKAYATEYSETGVVPTRPWAEAGDRVYGEIPLLNEDWTAYEVVEIRREQDGSAVITLQADLNGAEAAVYESKSAQFCLDPAGALISCSHNFCLSRYLSAQFGEGTDGYCAWETTRILDTSAGEIRERIQETVHACQEQCSADSTDTGHHSEDSGHHHHGW